MTENSAGAVSTRSDTRQNLESVLSRLGATPLTWVPRCQSDAREILLALDPAYPRQWFSGNQGQELGGMAVFAVAGAYRPLGLLDHLESIAN